MAKIIPTLNLNKVPQLVNNNSLVFAKNIKLLSDNTITKDNSIYNILNEDNIIGTIVGVNNKIYIFVAENTVINTTYSLKNIYDEQDPPYSNDIKENNIITNIDFVDLRYYEGGDIKLNGNKNIQFKFFINEHNTPILQHTTPTGTYFLRKGNIVKRGTSEIKLAENTFDTYYYLWNYNIDDEILRLYNLGIGVLESPITIKEDTIVSNAKIIEYDELKNTTNVLDTAWTYHGGKITGCVTINNTGEEILTIAEYFDNDIENINKNVPIKHINLKHCSENDNESIYTQHPNIPITNLKVVGYSDIPIPAGVYQFFIRYKIRKDFYTTWMPCSSELFAIHQESIDTIQGTIKYNAIRKESNKSFIFAVENLIKDNQDIYEEFQLGFIISRDNGVFARSWKHFKAKDPSINNIYFYYNETEIEDINIDDLLKSNYELFNVKNIIDYNNQLFISNYKETDFNDSACEIFAERIRIEIERKDLTTETNKFYLNGRELYSDGSCFTKFVDDDTKITDAFINRDYFIPGYSEAGTTIDVIHARLSPTFPKYYLFYIALVYKDNTKTTIFGNDSSIKTGELYDNNDAIAVDGYGLEYIVNVELDNNNTTLLTSIKGINESGEIIDINDNVVESIEYKIQTVNSFETSTWSAIIIKKQYKGNFYLINDIITQVYNPEDTIETLLPFTQYDFYCHFIKENGIITNGFKIGSKTINRLGEIDKQKIHSSDDGELIQNIDDYDINMPSTDVILAQTGTKIEFTISSRTNPPSLIGVYCNVSELKAYSNNNYILYPTFNIIGATHIPEGYVGYFISMYKHKNNVTEGFNIRKEDTTIRFDSMEHDTSLCNQVDNIKVLSHTGELLSNKGKYISSGVTDPINGFGSFGYIEYPLEDLNIEEPASVWTISNEHTNIETNPQLIKLTPFILGRNGYNDYKHLNMQGYLSFVSKLSKNDNYYVSDDMIYDKSVENNTLDLQEVTDKVDIEKTNTNIIHSNYNLNCVSLSEDIILKPRSYTIQEPDPSNNNNTIETQKTQMLSAVNSLTASYILEFQSTFNNYTRKTFTAYNKNNLTIFNNTVRCSNINVDETYRNIYRFDALDYYNIPTNRGIIIYMFKILDNIYIHTQHSLFKFSGNPKLVENNENVSLVQSSPFELGAKEVFDSQFGYGGLSKKEHSLVTFNAYIFYDKIANIIYLYDGGNSITPISYPIKKILEFIQPEDVIFALDNYNDRFYTNIKNNTNNKNVCLSYNFIAKSFISIHDMDFDYSFNSRIKPYFVKQHNNQDYLLSINFEDATGPIDYNILKTISTLECNDVDNIYDINSNYVASIIDIVCNTEYEKIKVLNSLSWICRAITQYCSANDFNIAQETGEKYSGFKLRIYSDQTQTPELLLTNNNGTPRESNSEPIEAKTSWQYPRYNCGVWTLNYFRDVNNIEDIYNYKNENRHYDTTDLTPKPQRLNLTQENSLIYGKYFVFRFTFKDKLFKLENIKVNMNDYGKA